MSKKKLITPEVIKMVQSSCDNGSNIVRYSMDCTRRFYVGRVLVIKAPDAKTLLSLDDTCSKEYMKVWRSDVGGVLLKEFRKGDIELYEIRDDKFKCLIKKISDDEIESFKENGFNHITIADSHYTIIRIIKKDSDYCIRDYFNDYGCDDYDFVNVSTTEDENELKKIEREESRNAIERESFELF